jgi:hypothetical protein
MARDELDGWARRASTANGFGDAGWLDVAPCVLLDRGTFEREQVPWTATTIESL